MIGGKTVVVVMPAYNAETTIEKTWQEVMDQGIVDLVIVVDDHSHDATVARARTLPKVMVHEHPKNVGYGGNQKTCYRLAVEQGADIVIMVHPDYQYTPKLIPAMAGLVASGLYQCVLGSRILGGGAIKGRMPWWRYVANRFLTAADNILIGSKLSEFHYRIPRLLARAAHIDCRSTPTPMILSLTTRCWPRPSGWDSRSVRSRARPGTQLTPPRSTFGAACNTASGASRRASCSGYVSGLLSDRRCFRSRLSGQSLSPATRPYDGIACCLNSLAE
jgi:hypothetical protein